MMTVEPRIVLDGTLVRLEPLGPEHVDDLFRAAQDDEIWRYLMIDRPTSILEMQRWVDDTLALGAGGSIVPFATVLGASGRAVGSTRYMEIALADYGIEIGWTWLGREHWRTGVNTECKYLLLRHAFESLGAIRVQLKTDLRNVRSQDAIARLGAVREGVLRNHRIVKHGYRRASVVFSILDDEWPAVSMRLQDAMARQSSEFKG